MYNLKNDPGETNDFSAENPELVNQLSNRLFTFLNEAGARFPEKDPLDDEALEKQHLERVKNEMIHLVSIL